MDLGLKQKSPQVGTEKLLKKYDKTLQRRKDVKIECLKLEEW